VNLQFGILQASGRGLGGRVSAGQLLEIKEETIRDWERLIVVAGWSHIPEVVINWGSTVKVNLFTLKTHSSGHNI
jgi:hypothetical protein